jgi:hypothetical protein
VPPRLAACRRDAVQHGIMRVRRRLVVEVHARKHMQQQAAHGHDHVDMRRFGLGLPCGLDRVERVAMLRVGAGAAAANASKAHALCIVRVLRIAPVAIHVRDFNQRVKHRHAISIQHTPFQQDTFAMRRIGGDNRIKRLVERVAVLRGGKPVGKVRPHRLRGGLSEVVLQTLHQHGGPF